MINQNSLLEAGQRVNQSDDETIFGLIVDMARKFNPVASHVLALSEIKHWTVQRTALALAYIFMIRDESHMAEMLDVVAKSTRPLIMNRHCANCTCVDKSLKIGDEL